MKNTSHQYRYSVLFVDDEEKSQKYFQKLFGGLFEIFVASDGVEGLAVFEKYQDKIGLVVTDQRMPNLAGSQMLVKIAEIKPDVIKLLSTAYSDIEAAIEAVNHGGIYRYITKPWDIPELEITLRRAMEFYELKTQMKNLSQMKITGLAQMQLLSRIFASSAVPSLLGVGSSAVAAMADLINVALSGLSEEDSANNEMNLNVDLLSESRAEALNAFGGQIEVIQELSSDANSRDGEDLANEVNAAQSALVPAFFHLIGGTISDEEKQLFATLFSAYRKGWKLDTRTAGGKMVQREEGDELGSVTQEICRLFLDDSMVVNGLIADISN